MPDYDDLPMTLTPKDVAQILGMTLNQTYRLFRCKDFPSSRIGEKYLIPKPKFLHWLGTE